MAQQYDQNAIDSWWWGADSNGPGSATDIKPGAYVLMKQGDVIALTNKQSAAYDPAFSAILSYLYSQAVLKKSGIGPTGANGFADVSTIGGVRIDTIGGGGDGWNGPTQS
jgi:hypothetical protein